MQWIKGFIYGRDGGSTLGTAAAEYGDEWAAGYKAGRAAYLQDKGELPTSKDVAAAAARAYIDYQAQAAAVEGEGGEGRYFDWYAGGNNALWLRIPAALALECSGPGSADNAVAAALQDPAIALQVAALDPAAVATELDEYTDWDASDRDENAARLLWIAAGDIRERIQAGDGPDGPADTRAFHYTAHYGGVLIVCQSTGKTVLLQAGDDSAEFWKAIEGTNERYTDDDVCAQYFGLDRDDDEGDDDEGPGGPLSGGVEVEGLKVRDLQELDDAGDDEGPARVYFRVDCDDEGDVYALFPDLPWNDAGAVTFYMHLGQHGAADLQHCLDASRPATAAEYAELQAELEGRGYVLIISGPDNEGPAGCRAGTAARAELRRLAAFLQVATNDGAAFTEFMNRSSFDAAAIAVYPYSARREYILDIPGEEGGPVTFYAVDDTTAAEWAHKVYRLQGTGAELSRLDRIYTTVPLAGVDEGQAAA